MGTITFIQEPPLFHTTLQSPLPKELMELSTLREHLIHQNQLLVLHLHLPKDQTVLSEMKEETMHQDQQLDLQGLHHQHLHRDQMVPSMLMEPSIQQLSQLLQPSRQ